MPHRLESIFVFVSAICGAFASGLAAIVNGGASFIATGIIDNRTMLFTCIVGAIGGSLVSIIFFPPRDAAPRALAWKFFGSGVTAAIFAPYAVHRLAETPTAEFVLFVSGTIALSAHTLMTILRRAAVARTKKLLGDPDEKKTDTDGDSLR
jgi:hypothetical protein